jgi:hypothetical protein
MPKKLLLALCVTAIGLAVACGKSNSPVSPSPSTSGTDALPDGSTLKINAPQVVFPTNGIQLQRNQPFVVTLNNVQGRFATFPVTYELEIRSAGGGGPVATHRFPAAQGNSTSFTVDNELEFDADHTLRVRATYRNSVGPWSQIASFRTPKKAFLDPVTGAIFDPLTAEIGPGQFSVGKVRGGRFIPGQGWQVVSRSDGIDYDIPTCADCRLEFDITGIGDGLGQPHDDKWLSMGDGTLFDEFNAFRDQDWKMTLEQRADGDGTGMKLIWRNGDAGDDDPGDHTGKQDPGPDWQENVVYHFIVDWTPTQLQIFINGEKWFEDGFAEPYAPPNHRVSLGCYPRGESRRDTIFSNVVLTPRR